MPKGIPLTEEAHSLRRREIFNASVSLFLEHGFQETSMQQIAGAAGIGKSTLYDYFKTKDEILLSFVEDAIENLKNEAEEIARQDQPAKEKLQQVLRAYMAYLIEKKEFFTKLSLEVQRLKIESQIRLQSRRHAYQDILRKLIDDAVQEGSFRPVDSLLAARTILTLLAPAVYTSRPSGTPEQMMDEALNIFYYGPPRVPSG